MLHLPITRSVGKKEKKKKNVSCQCTGTVGYIVVFWKADRGFSRKLHIFLFLGKM